MKVTAAVAAGDPASIPAGRSTGAPGSVPTKTTLPVSSLRVTSAFAPKPPWAAAGAANRSAATAVAVKPADHRAQIVPWTRVSEDALRNLMILRFPPPPRARPRPLLAD